MHSIAVPSLVLSPPLPFYIHDLCFIYMYMHAYTYVCMYVCCVAERETTVENMI